MIIIISVEGHTLAAVSVDTAPGAFHDPGTKQVLHQFCHIVAVAFLPAVGKPLFSVHCYVGNKVLMKGEIIYICSKPEQNRPWILAKWLRHNRGMLLDV